MGPVGLAIDAPASSHRNPTTAKTYNRIKLTTGIASAILSFLSVALLVMGGYTATLAGVARTVTANEYIGLLVFAFLIGAFQTLLTLPLGFYSGYIIEHRFGLSHQNLRQWAWEKTKGMLVGLPLGTAMLMFLYYCLQTFGSLWWLPVGAGMLLISVALARLAPVIILPLFYKVRHLEEGPIKERIRAMCTAAGVKIDGVFTFNLSKNTKKANAAFTGIGRTKRIILGDTLLVGFPEDEIETVFAHELGHYVHHHILLGMLINVISTMVGLYLTSVLYSASLGWFGFASLTDLAALPLLALWLSLFGLVTSPLGNAVSRYFEREADRYAVETTGKKEAFTSALRRLEATNLVDPEPHVLVEWFFHSHPSIARRIKEVAALTS
jgi:STE24 endopeptidase